MDYDLQITIKEITLALFFLAKGDWNKSRLALQRALYRVKLHSY